MSARVPSQCQGPCKAFDAAPRHIVFDPAQGIDASVCFQCATDLGVADYSEIIAAAEAAGVSLTDYVLANL